ncbi:phycobiliprotein lyase [Altericista sp. CCNU0014]|uniref:phycobiliprotein lyase n=1 Tax=Altericista sp. CCNU0014 TaxID=3082949 RepID=UPI00384BAE67
MDIQSFFQLCDGKWISQRTTHHLIDQNNQSGRSDLWGEILEGSHGEIAALCQQLDVDPSSARCGLRLRWSEVTEAYQSRFKPKEEGMALLVAIASDSPHSGQLLRSLNSANGVTGTYSIGTDEALTLRLEDANVISEERIWFASPNLRLRSSSIKKDDTVCITTFCSEIRMATPVESPPAESTAGQFNAPAV